MSLKKAGISDLNSIANIEKNSYKKPFWNERKLMSLFSRSFENFPKGMERPL